MVICPITSQYKPYPFIVVLPELLLSKPSYVLADQVKSLDWKKRNVEFIQTAPAKVLTEVTMYTRGIIEGRTGISI
jgi:mRNA interferase MazF